MFRRLVASWILAVLCLSAAAGAADLKPSAMANPAAAKEPEFNSPEINSDGSVTFRFYAPSATTVLVQGLRNHPPVSLNKETAGVWSATVAGLVPDIYSYTFTVDGATALDPHNRYVKRWIHSESAFELPGNPPMEFSVQSVPHGVVHRHTYSSRLTGTEWSYLVYTPPGYNPHSSTSYPLLFLLHGFGDDEAAWIDFGRANFIADNLIARDTSKKVVIVMPNGHPVPRAQSLSSDYGDQNAAMMEKVLLSEILPQVEAFYSVSHRPRDRAIVGLSMGGGQSLHIGLNHPEVFQWVGAFSAAAPTEDLEKRFPLLARATGKEPSSKDHGHGPRLLWFGIGKDDFLFDRNVTFTAWLKQKGIPFSWKVTDGGHEWSLWRSFLGEFLQHSFH